MSENDFDVTSLADARPKSPLSAGETGRGSELSRLALLSASATQGEWFQCGLPWFKTGSGVLAGSPDPHVGALVASTEDWDGERDEHNDNDPATKLANADDDAAFIVAAVNYVRGLISRVSDGSRAAGETQSGSIRQDGSAVGKAETPDIGELIERLEDRAAKRRADNSYSVSPDILEQAAQALTLLKSERDTLARNLADAEAGRDVLHDMLKATESENRSLSEKVKELEGERDEAVKQERESCAFCAETVSGFGDPWTIETIAANIRARGPEDENELVHVPREIWERLNAAESALSLPEEKTHD